MPLLPMFEDFNLKCKNILTYYLKKQFYFGKAIKWTPFLQANTYDFTQINHGFMFPNPGPSLFLTLSRHHLYNLFNR